MENEDYKQILFVFEEALEECINLEKENNHHFYSLGLGEAKDLLEMAIDGANVEELIKHFKGED